MQRGVKSISLSSHAFIYASPTQRLIAFHKHLDGESVGQGRMEAETVDEVGTLRREVAGYGKNPGAALRE